MISFEENLTTTKTTDLEPTPEAITNVITKARFLTAVKFAALLGGMGFGTTSCNIGTIPSKDQIENIDGINHGNPAIIKAEIKELTADSTNVAEGAPKFGYKSIIDEFRGETTGKDSLADMELTQENIQSLDDHGLDLSGSMSTLRSVDKAYFQTKEGNEGMIRAKDLGLIIPTRDAGENAENEAARIKDPYLTKKFNDNEGRYEKNAEMIIAPIGELSLGGIERVMISADFEGVDYTLVVSFSKDIENHDVVDIMIFKGLESDDLVELTNDDVSGVGVDYQGDTNTSGYDLPPAGFLRFDVATGVLVGADHRDGTTKAGEQQESSHKLDYVVDEDGVKYDAKDFEKVKHSVRVIAHVFKNATANMKKFEENPLTEEEAVADIQNQGPVDLKTPTGSHFVDGDK